MTVRAMRRRAARHLREAGRARHRGDAEAFHGEMAAAIHGHLGDRLGTSTLGVPWAQVDLNLADRGVDEDLRRRLRDLFDRTDFARFAPGADAEGAMDQLHEDAMRCLRELGRQLSARRGRGQ